MARIEKKAVLSQRRLRDAPYIWVPLFHRVRLESS